MTNTTAELLTVDGVPLNTYAKNISTLAGRLRSAQLRTANIQLPMRNGQLRVPRKWYDPVVLDLPMWVVGCDDNGNVPSGSNARIEFFKRIDELASLFASPDLLTVRHTLPDGSIRECMAEMLQALDFSTSAVTPKGLFDVQLTVPDAFWRDIADKTNSITNPTLPYLFNLPNFAGATAPMDDLTITITGPVTNPRVEAYRNGAALGIPVWFQYTGTIASGQTLIVNCATWALSGTSAPVYSNFTHVGDARFLSVPPAPSAGTPQVRFTGTSTSAVTAISVVGRRKFLVG